MPRDKFSSTLGILHDILCLHQTPRKDDLYSLHAIVKLEVEITPAKMIMSISVSLMDFDSFSVSLLSVGSLLHVICNIFQPC